MRTGQTGDDLFVESLRPQVETPLAHRQDQVGGRNALGKRLVEVREVVDDVIAEHGTRRNIADARFGDVGDLRNDFPLVGLPFVVGYLAHQRVDGGVGMADAPFDPTDLR